MRSVPSIFALLLAILSTLWLVLAVAIPASTHLTNGFSAYYTAGRLVREGAPAERFYDDEWFRAQTIRFGFEHAPDIYNVNPPATALIFWPLAALDPLDARAAWTWLSLTGLILSAAAMTAMVKPPLPEGEGSGSFADS